VELAIYLNAAVTAYDLQREVRGLEQANLRVVYGVCDLGDLRVRALPAAKPATDPESPTMFADAPEKAEDFVALAERLGTRVIQRGILT
jgi:hypothetical protein